MGGQFRSEEAESQKASLQGVFLVLADSANLIRNVLEDMEDATKGMKSKVAIYLHDEIATAEELARMIDSIDIHVLTEEELADRG